MIKILDLISNKFMSVVQTKNLQSRPTKPTPQQTASYNQIFSLNCKGLNNNIKRRSIFEYCKSEKYGIIFLQETHSTNAIEHSWNNENTDSSVFYSHGESNSKGVITIINKQLNCNIVETYLDPNGRYILLKFGSKRIRYYWQIYMHQQLKKNR